MDADRWSRLEAIFEAVVDLPPAARAARLEAACSDDPTLRPEIERLLAHADDGSVRLARVIENLARTSPPAEVDFTGRRLGAYRIVRQVGRGGMGVVFEAVRADDEFQKRVALKVAARAPFAPDFAQRFRHERQILAKLEHPHIARMLDGGTTEDGVPFFAMEFVEGTPIHRYAAERQLTIAQRINLFLQVCDAVEYAHQNLVIHRDLKPTNLLVADGSVRLLDFGIAKLIDAGELGDTQTGLAPITPEYCSPEQIRSAPVTTRSDIYSLGLVLSELLTGQRAQSPDTTSALTLTQSICETPIAAPSVTARQAGDRALARHLAGDLDTIVLTATQKEPLRRYASVAALADDLRATLVARPIRARQDSRWYRTRRFARRHWLPLAASLLLAASLVAGIIATTYQARRAERRFEQVRRIANALVVDVHDAIRDLPASTKAQEVVIKTAVEYLDGLAQEAGGDRTLAVELAQGYVRVGELSFTLDRPSLSKQEDAQTYYTRAAAILEPLLATDGTDPATAAAASTLDRMKASLAHYTGRSVEAVQLGERAIATATAALARHPEHMPLLATLEESYTNHLALFPNNPALDIHVPRLIDVSERLARLRPLTATSLGQLGVTYSLVGKYEASAVKFDEALGYFRRAVELQTQAIGLEPDNATARRNLMLAWSNLADVAMGPLGTYSYTGFSGPAVDIDDDARREALDAWRNTLEHAEWLYQRDPTNETAVLDYAICLGRRAFVLAPGDAEAFSSLRRALELITVVEPKYPGQAFIFNLEFRGQLAERHRQLDALDEARREWRQVEAIIDKALVADVENYLPRRIGLSVFYNWALTEARAGGTAEARRLARRIEQFAAGVGERAAQYARAPGWPPRAQAWLAEIHDALGDAAQASDARRKSLAQWREVALQEGLPRDVLDEATKIVAAAGSR